MKNRIVCGVLFLILFAVGSVSASLSNEIGSSTANSTIKAVQDSICKSITINSTSVYVNETAGCTNLDTEHMGIIGLIRDLTLANPSIYDENKNIKTEFESVERMHNFLKDIAVFLFVIAMIISGILWTMSSSPHEIADAKIRVKRLLIGMVLVVMATDIYYFAIELSSSIATEIFNQGFKEALLTPFISGIGNAVSFPIFGLILYCVLCMALLVLAIRFIVLIGIYVLLPLGLFMYFFDFPFVKTLGQRILLWFVDLLMMQIIFAILFVIALIAGANIGLGAFVSLVFLLAGALAIIAAPLYMFVSGGSMGTIGISGVTTAGTVFGETIKVVGTTADRAGLYNIGKKITHFGERVRHSSSYFGERYCKGDRGGTITNVHAIPRRAKEKRNIRSLKKDLQ